MGTILLALNPNRVPQEPLAQIKTLASEARIVVTKDRDEMEAVLDDVEIAAGVVPYDLIVTAPRLRWFQQWWAGADWLFRYPKALERDFILTNVSGIHAIPMSEHILALLLAFARRLPESCRAQVRHEWIAHQQRRATFELAGKTVLLVGLGAVGKRTARLAAALGMRVLGVRRNPAQEVPGVDKIVGPEQLCDLLPDADFMVLTVPFTPETQRFIGVEELKRMKSTAYLVNVGRGGTIDEDALVQALREHWIAGAGLDVLEMEPLPEDSPLWDMDNVIITAHYAGSTPHYNERAGAVFLDNLQRYQAGEPLRNVVDKRLGY